MNSKVEFISIGEASRLTGICQQTLRKLSDQQRINSYKTMSGQRKFDRRDLENICKGSLYKPMANTSLSSKSNFIYARISTMTEYADLSRQIEQIKAANKSYETYTVVTDISTGVNYKRRGLAKILDACINGTVGEVVATHKDRICRVAFDLFEQIVEKAGGKITIIDDKSERDQIEKELSEDFLSLARVYAKRAQ